MLRNELNERYRKKLFQFLEIAQQHGAYFCRIEDVDALVNNKKAGFFIKHDIHGLNLDRLVEFAKDEKDMGVICTYFFMVPDHPLTTQHYNFSQQVQAMIAIRSLGHSLGIHIDPFFLIDYYKKPFKEVFGDIIARFNDSNISIKSGNIHGNSAFKGLDNNGFGTSFDLFEEIARQPDFPKLKQVPYHTAETIRKNRTKLSSHGITHWGDMPLWSHKNNYIVTNFVSDNHLVKKGVMNVLVQHDTIGNYKLSDRQPPGSRSHSIARALVSVNADTDLLGGYFQIDIDGSEILKMFKNIANHPVQFLVHPEFYC